MAGNVRSPVTGAVSLSQIQVFGDSLAEGMGYDKVKKNLPSVSLTVSRVYGEHSGATLDRLRNSGMAKGSTVVVFTGANDLISIGRGVIRKPDEVLNALKKNIEAMEAWAKTNNIRLVLVTIPPCRSHRSYHNALAEMPEETMKAVAAYNAWLLKRGGQSVRVLDLSILGNNPVQGRPDEMQRKYLVGSPPREGLHPNEAGYVVISNLLKQSLGI